MSRSNREIINRNLYHIFWACLAGFLIWVAYSSYQALSQEPEIKVDSQIISPISTTMDEKVLEGLGSRRLINEDDVKMIAQEVVELEELVPQTEESTVASSTPDTEL